MDAANGELPLALNPTFSRRVGNGKRETSQTQRIGSTMHNEIITFWRKAKRDVVAGVALRISPRHWARSFPQFIPSLRPGTLCLLKLDPRKQIRVLRKKKMPLNVVVRGVEREAPSGKGSFPKLMTEIKKLQKNVP